MPPQSETGLYYRIRSLDDFRKTQSMDLPLSFSDLVEPLGFTIPTDASGDRLKASINLSLAYDIGKGEYVSYPLATRPT